MNTTQPSAVSSPCWPKGSVFPEYLYFCVNVTVTLWGLSSVKTRLVSKSRAFLLPEPFGLHSPPPPSVCVIISGKTIIKKPFEKHMVFQFCDRYLLLLFRMAICLRVSQWQHYCPVKLLKASDSEVISGAWGTGGCMMFHPVDILVSWWKNSLQGGFGATFNSVTATRTGLDPKAKRKK